MDEATVKAGVSEVVYNPSSLLNIFANAFNNEMTRKPFTIQGIYMPKNGQEYSGFYYDSLKDEYTDSSMTFLVHARLRNKLQPGQKVECQVYLTKKVISNGGRIELVLNLIDVISQKQVSISEEELKSIEVLQRKAAKGYKDLDTFIKNRIIAEEKIKVTIVTGKTGIVDSDIKHQLKEGISFYDFNFVRTSLSNELELMDALKYHSGRCDILCVARGGGENVEFFNKYKLADSVLGFACYFVTAIGHKEDVTLLQKVADKGFITPTALGHYFHDVYTRTVEELQDSKAKLIEQITTQLKGNYEKQVQNLNDKLKAAEQLFEKSKSENISLHDKELAILKKEKESINQQYRQEVKNLQQLNIEKEKSLKDQIETLKQQLNKTPETNYGGIVIIVVVIVVLLLLMRTCNH